MLLYFVNGGCPIVHAIEVCKPFFIAHGTQGIEVPKGQQGACFGLQPIIYHLIHAEVDSTVKVFPWPVGDYLMYGKGTWLFFTFGKLRIRPSGTQTNFECAAQAHIVGFIDFGEVGRIVRLYLGVQPWQPARGPAFVHMGAYVGRNIREGIETLTERGDEESRTASQHCNRPFLINLVKHSQRVALEVARRIVVMNRKRIDEVVRGTGQFGGRGFGCTDGHFTVELSAVGRDDFRAKKRCQLDGGFCFAATCCATNYDEMFHTNKNNCYLRAMNFINRGKSSGFLFTFGKTLLPWQMSNQFRRINLNGLERIPVNTPVLLAANHPTAFIDPVLLGVYSKPPLYFMTRGDLFASPTTRRIFESFNMFPVKRTRDGFTDLDRLDEMTQFVMESLEARRVLCIFVEGMHHADKRVLPIQKGIGRIAFSAYDKYQQSDLQIIPIGCNYWASDQTRDVASINVGKPIFVKDYWETYQNLPAQATHQLCRDIYEAIKPLCHHINDSEDDNLAEKLLTLHRSRYPIGHFPVVHYNNHYFEGEKDVTEWLNTLNDEEKTKLKKKIKKYFGHLEAYNISDEALMHPEWASIGRWMFLVLFFPFFIVGFMARLPIAALAHYGMHNLAQKREFKSSIYLGIEFFVGIVWLLLLLIAALLSRNPLWIGTAMALPVLYWFSTIYPEIAERAFKAMRALQHTERKKLLQEREKL